MKQKIITPVFGTVNPILINFSEGNAAKADFWKSNPEEKKKPSKTKLICTIGPASNSFGKIEELINAGMNVARLNFSHGTHSEHKKVIETIRSVQKKTNKLCAIMLDTKGPEIRTGKFKNNVLSVKLKIGQKFKLITGDLGFLGDENGVSVTYENLGKVIVPGNTILIDDGLISLKVVKVSGNAIECVVECDAVLGRQKGINLPGILLPDLPAITEQDKTDIQFGIKMKVDFIAASFVRKADDIRQIRSILGPNQIQIISKIENQEGIENFNEILNISNGIMVARGDLGVEIPIERVALAQKVMIRNCNGAGKIVVTATQMLESMCENPFPTRAEASDVGNAVFDGTDCVMLSGETAKGKYPIKAAQMMSDICRETEQSINYKETFRVIHERSLAESKPFSVSEANASSAVKAAMDLNASMMVVLSNSGYTGRLVSKYRPNAPILLLTDSEEVARKSLVSRGLVPLLVDCMIGGESLVTRAVEIGKSMGFCKVGDVIVVVTGSRPEGSSCSDPPHTIRVVTVKEM